MKKYKKSGDKVPPETPYTPSVSLMYAMREALNIIMEEGLEQRVIRHKMAAKATRAGVKALGLELFAEESAASNTVTAIKMPEGVTDKDMKYPVTVNCLKLQPGTLTGSGMNLQGNLNGSHPTERLLNGILHMRTAAFFIFI